MQHTSTASRRLQKEAKDIRSKNDENDVILSIVDDDLFHWKAWILGPVDTPYSNAYFSLDITIPENYPIQPPVVRFLTPIFHPNIQYKDGEICLDLLKSSDKWTPCYTLESVCRSIINLLAEPEHMSPLNCDCGNLIRCGDLRGYYSLARMYTRLHAEFNLFSQLDQNPKQFI